MNHQTGEAGRVAPDASTMGAIGAGVLVLLAGTIPRNVLFAANLRLLTSVPWAVPVTAAYLWPLWRYLDGHGGSASTRAWRHASLRANPVAPRTWLWSLLAGGSGMVALVLALRLLNRLVPLPAQPLPDLSPVPAHTVWALLVMSAPVAGLVEEAAFRGYMQQPLERRYGLTRAILITGTMFAVVHLDFTPVLWPYYVAVATIYGTVAYFADSIWPAIALHTAGNLYSNTGLLLHGQAEWQAPSTPATLVWRTGVDSSFVVVLATAILAASLSIAAYRGLRRGQNLGSS